MFWQAYRLSHCGTVLPKHFASSNRNDVRGTCITLQQLSLYREYFRKQVVLGLQIEQNYPEANQTDQAAEAEEATSDRYVPKAGLC